VNQSRRRSVLPPQNVAPIQTFRWQQLPTAQTSPDAQSELLLQPGRFAHGVLPSTQNPVPSTVLPQIQLPPAPQVVNVAHVSPAQLGFEHAPLEHLPEGH